jgi:hypothetical protein
MAVLNAHQMLVQGLNLARLDSTDTTLLGEWNAAFLAGVNQAYIDLYRVLDIRTYEAETLSATKTFATTGLSFTPDQIFGVYEYIPYSSSASYSTAQKYEIEWDNTTVYVPDAGESQTVYVHYRPLPTPLVNANPTTGGTGATSPVNIPEQYQISMIYKGIAEFYNAEGDVERRDDFEMKYFQSRSNIRPMKKQRRIVNINQY